MKVAFLSPNWGKYSETFIRAQYEHLPFDLSLFTGGYLPTQQLNKQSGVLEDLSSYKKWWEGNRPERNFERALKAKQVDLLLVQYGLTGAEIMHTAARLNLPFIVHFHGFDAYRDDVMAGYRERYTEMFQRAEAIIAVSKHMVDQLTKLGCPADKIHYLACGVDVERFKPAEETGTCLLSCGRFVEKKGPLLTLEAFERLIEKRPDACLRMIGDGPLRAAAEQYVEENRLKQQVEFLGILTPEQVAHEMSKAFCFVQHSRRTSDNDSEGTPVSVLEAAAAGLPIVATRHAGIVDVVEEKESGLLVEEGDVVEMAKCMDSLLNDPLKAREMGRRGREIIKEKYQQSHYLAALSQIIEGCSRDK